MTGSEPAGQTAAPNGAPSEPLPWPAAAAVIAAGSLALWGLIALGARVLLG